MLHDVSLLTPEDLHLFNEGKNYRIHEKMGAHVLTHEGQSGTLFSVWAPNARDVSVIGDFNNWNPYTHELHLLGESGIWQGFIPGVGQGALYKYRVTSRQRGHRVDKADPVAFSTQKPPETASCVWDLDYQWNDSEWMAARKEKDSLQRPISIYEMHLGSWMRVPEEDDRPLTYRETGAPAGGVPEAHEFHPRGIAAGDGASVLRLVGIPDHRLISRPPRATARRRISCTWWTICTSKALA